MNLILILVFLLHSHAIVVATPKIPEISDVAESRSVGRLGWLSGDFDPGIKMNVNLDPE